MSVATTATLAPSAVAQPSILLPRKALGGTTAPPLPVLLGTPGGSPPVQASPEDAVQSIATTCDASSIVSHGSSGTDDSSFSFSASSSSSTSAAGLLLPPEMPLPLPPQPRLRLNKFVRRLHDMLRQEKDTGIVEWRRGLLVLHSTDAFAKTILPKHFNTRNFKTFRRQLNYYGFIHVRSFSTTGSTTTALWVNRELAEQNSGSADDGIDSVLTLRRVEPCEDAKTADGRRSRKEQALHTVEEDLGVSAKSLQMDQIRHLALRLRDDHATCEGGHPPNLLSLVMGGLVPAPTALMVATAEDPPALGLALRPPPPLALLPSPIRPVEAKKTTKVSDDKASAANLLLLLSKAS